MPFTVGVDLGQAIDPTAVLVVESGRPDPTPQDARPPIEHLVRHIERVPLGTSYIDVVEKISHVAETVAAAFGQSVMTVVDATGVGRPVVDMLRRRLALPLRAVTFTAAADEVHPDPHAYRVPKRDLVQSLEVVLQGRRLHTAPGLLLAEDLRAELQAFQVNLSAHGHDSYEAGRGKHDDLVMALCLAVWWGSRRGQGAAFSEAWARMAARPR